MISHSLMLMLLLAAKATAFPQNNGNSDDGGGTDLCDEDLWQETIGSQVSS